MEKDRKDRALTPKSAMARNKKPMDNELARALATQYIMNTTNNDSGRFQAEKSRTRSPINSEEYDELSDPRSLFGFESPIEKTPESVIDKPEVEKKRKMSDWYKKNVLYMRPSQDVEHEVVHEKDTLLEDASSRSVSSQGTVLVNVRSKNSNQQGASKYRKEKISRDEHDNKTLDLNSNVERNGEWSGKDENGVFNPAMRPEEMVSPLKLHSEKIFKLAQQNKMASIYKRATRDETELEAEENASNTTHQKVLILSSRGITQRYRHLLSDLSALLPHSKKDSKLDTKKRLGVINEIADLYNCSNVIFFEARKHEELYMWVSRAPTGPSIKFHVQNVHTMSELKLNGNCLKGSRPILSFDSTFDSSEQFMLIKSMFEQVFGVPKSAKKIKPFFDHVMSFSIIDNKIWVRNYQIVEKDPVTGADTSSIKSSNVGGETMNLLEIGPRFVLNTIRIFDDSFGGKTLFENENFMTPASIRSMLRSQKSGKYGARIDSNLIHKHKIKNTTIPDNSYSSVFK
ncbi:Ribosome biogenesis protein BRX1 [Zancudomyces culisetae]|uniref:Ribosome biogenesis protein BRX1 n=1 Tax=Zancudomyces culisetae TaxID=1213189 RepID=A0A1R1PYP8_ZANCU|nr:Ribosome biogenesis protein BRX1 [Zancudomyces culisetae]|eukprot:OMH86088.1 Ribosome biogenesis protein BRX1 [Zancudomyces culisetae]